jgi:HTH-like domain
VRLVEVPIQYARGQTVLLGRKHCLSPRIPAAALQKAYSVAHVCRLLDVSRSCFYEASKRAEELVSICPVALQLKASFAASGGCYGGRPLRNGLRAKGMKIGLYKIRRLMHANGLRSAWKRKFVHTTDSKHDLPIAENVLNLQFEPEAANKAGVADITYIRTRGGWLYLAVVLDLFSRKIVDCSMAPTCLLSWCVVQCNWRLLSVNATGADCPLGSRHPIRELELQIAAGKK